MSRKEELIKCFELKMKVLQLQEKYSQNPFSAVIFALNAVQETIKVSKELREPEPTFPRGLTIINYDSKEKITAIR
tara:strand:- start:4500 stop:4727 length:228 start_codon:yes stop_codon:yes gene_type:complete